MTAIFWGTGYGFSAGPTGTLTYSNYLAPSMWASTFFNTESAAQFYNGTAGTLSLWTISITSNGRTTTTSWTVRKNGGNGNSTLSYAAGITGTTQDTTHTDPIAAADLLNVAQANGSGSGSVPGGFFIQYAPTGGGTTFPICAGATLSGPGSGAATTFSSIIGDVGNPGAVEATAQSYVQVAGTIKDFFVNTTTNPRTSTTTFTVRASGADLTSNVSFAAGVFGQHVDTSDTDAISVGNLICIKVVTGTGSGMNVFARGCTCTSGTDGKFWAGGYDNSSTTTNVFGSVVSTQRGNATESAVQYQTGLAATAKGMWEYVVSNTSATTVTVRWRSGGANGSQIISWAAGVTGSAQDTSNSDIIGTATNINIAWTGISATTAVTFAAISFEFDVTVAASNPWGWQVSNENDNVVRRQAVAA